VSKSPLILKNPKTKIIVHKNYLELFIDGSKYVISFLHILEIYLNKNISIKPSQLIAIAKKCPLYFIDHHGYVVGALKVCF
jgi:hypothetical protein